MYRAYLLAIRHRYAHILRFDEYLIEKEKFDSYCLIRHDVDRKPMNALNMAILESELGIKSTYFFRCRKSVFKKEIVQEIYNLGHEIGYHYENLSDAKGDLKKSYKDFDHQLNQMRSVVPIKTISMHGKPLSKFDNRDMWKHDSALKYLNHTYNILGEIYLHINYTDIAYIGDTGRNWSNTKSNKRDHVNSSIDLNLNNSEHLLHVLRKEPPKKLIFQVHPERWSSNAVDYTLQLLKDKAVNIIKIFV